MSRHLQYATRDPLVKLANQSTYEAILRCIQWFGNRFNIDNLTILDFGCGRGELLGLCLAHGYKSIGCDIDPVCVNLSSKQGSVFLLDPNNIEESVSKNIKYADIICLSHVLEHVPNPQKLLMFLRKKAKYGMIISVPNPHSLNVIIKSLIRRPPRGINKGHYYSWDYDHLKTFIETQCSMKIIHYEYDSVYMPAPIYVRKVLFKLGILRFLENQFLRWLFPRFSRSIIVVIGLSELISGAKEK